jgi:uncharacterized protein (TIGR02246 family)
MADTLSQADDRRQIRDLGLRYAQAVDQRDADKLAALFVEDGLLDGSGYESRGHEAIRKIPPMLSRRYQATFHSVQNHLIELDGDQASGEVYALSHHLQRKEDGSLTDFVMVMRYQDRYVRQGDGWRFAHRHILVDWTETRPAEPHVPPRPRPAA